MKYNKIAIIGTGLIGGSIGKALISRGLADEVIGVCRRESSLKRAIDEKAVTKCFVNNYEEALEGVDIIFIATPVETVKEVLEKLSSVKLKKGVIVTDVGSTKKDIVDFAAKYKSSFIFLGTHPLAGSEKTGVEFAKDGFFEDSVCVLTPDKDIDKRVIDRMQLFWQDLGARVEVITPDEHDLILAYTSHLPHIAAYALAGSADESFAPFVSTGFKDTTRIASSDPLLWAEIFLTNKDNVLKTIARYKSELSIIEESIKQGDEKRLIGILENYKRIRDEIV